jgi:ribonuclease inhibitor
MRMKTSTSLCILPGREIRSLEEFYDAISARLPFPAHFGRNLDALWDVLTTDLKGPINIAWKESALSRQAMGTDYERIASLLTDVQKERDDFHVTFR